MILFDGWHEPGVSYPGSGLQVVMGVVPVMDYMNVSIYYHHYYSYWNLI